ncbi:histidine phosphatase family protein [Williamsia sp. DF01-3]|uniref:SixA phosphatase family protein n=1 Tax=Williamsia sp. DF01-3 TaxID=2934157 RepID=UPI001FF4C7B8|nr:histidine phosphatase family protein [Williamsia sp. DF01-3]MCK0519912.1 histidine phosphatase family protein [Williamsia sp. DF01-3]
MRHGKSAYPSGTPDQERPLAERGQREAALAGRWMADDGLAVDAVLCSTAVRTRQTLQHTGIDAPATFVEDIYGGDADDVCEAIRLHAPADAATILVIGHEPGMPDTAMTLDPAAHIPRFPTSAYAVVETETAWDQLGLTPDSTTHMTRLAIPRE